MTDGLKTLVLDRWYKVVIWVGIAILFIGLTTPLQVPNKAVLAMALGAIAFGIGQWINHPLQTRMLPGAKLTSYNRKPCVSGVLTELAGAGVFGFGLYLLVIA